MTAVHAAVAPLIRNCEEWCAREGVSLTVLATRIGRKHDFFSALKRGSIPKMDVLIKLSEVMDVTLDRLVSPSIRLGNEAPDKSEFADRVLELASEFVEKRNGFSKPSAQSVLNWLVRNGSTIEMGDPMVSQIEIFRVPDRTEPLPRPIVVGHQSLMSMEAGIQAPEHLLSLIHHSDVELMRDIAVDHLAAADGQPGLDTKVITLDTGSAKIECEYDRLLAPARFNGEKVVINYSVARSWRSSRIDHRNELDAAGGRQPVLAR